MVSTTRKDGQGLQKENKSKADETKITVEPKLTAKPDSTKFPDLIDQGDKDAFYNEEIKVEDELFKFGEIEGSIQYLGSAVVVEVHPLEAPPEPAQTLLRKRLPLITHQYEKSYNFHATIPLRPPRRGSGISQMKF